MLAIAKRWLLLRHPQAAATSAGHLREVQLQTRAASADILCSVMLKYRGQSLAASLGSETKPRSTPQRAIKSGTSLTRTEVNCSSLKIKFGVLRPWFSGDRRKHGMDSEQAKPRKHPYAAITANRF